MGSNKSTNTLAKHKVVKKQSTTSTSSATFRSAGKESAASRILSATLVLESILRTTMIPRKQAMIFASVKATTEPCALSKLKMEGSIQYDRTCIQLLDKGRAKAGRIHIPSNNRGVQAYLKEKFLTGKHARLFDIMCDGRIHNRRVLGASVGINNKATLASTFSRMVQTNLAEYPDKDSIQLTSICFPYDA